MKYDLILFDLDGTLTDPGEGITNSVAYALKQLGIEPPERRELYKFIGPPLVDSFMEYYAMDKAKAEEAVRLYRVYFADRGIFENIPYTGIGEALGRLRSAGERLALATSKPTVFAERILERFGLDGYFDIAVGSELDGTRNAKADVIRCVLERAGEYKRAVMVGDRLHDINGAKAAGVDSIGVLYGYGSREELENAGADYIAAGTDELCAILLGDMGA